MTSNEVKTEVERKVTYQVEVEGIASAILALKKVVGDAAAIGATPTYITIGDNFEGGYRVHVICRGDEAASS